MTKLSELKRRWLEDFGWQEITSANRQLCEKTHSFHGPTSDGHDDCAEFWEKRQHDELSFNETLSVLKDCHRKAPFCFNNGNTFAAVARELVFEVKIPAESAAIVRSAVGHYVAGVLRDDELDAVLDAILVD
jgi:hypothetical protein